MAITWATLFNHGPIVYRSHTAKADALTIATAQGAWPATAVATPEHDTLRTTGALAFAQMIAGQAAVQNAASSTIAAWREYAARYIRDNESTYDGITSDEGVFARMLIGAMLDGSQTIDASAPSIGSVVYPSSTIGGGTATMAVNSDTTLGELLLAGLIELECIEAGFAVQNAERWRLSWVGVDPRTGGILRRTSASRNGSRIFKTGERYFDVQVTQYPGVGISPDPRLIVPQTGGAIHTGLNILISAPTYTPTEVSGDADSVVSAVSVNLIDGTKSNLTARNTTFNAVGDPRRIYLRIAKDGTDYNMTWYQDSGLTVALTNTITVTTGTGTATQTWTTASTNPENTAFGGHLATGSNFISATIAAGSLTQSATVIYSSEMPWHRGDKITAVATNAYGGIYSRFFVEEMGFPIPADGTGSETIADPSA